MAEYPKYKREEKLNTKLSDDDIKEIKVLRMNGLSLRAIARKYNVVSYTIWCACLTEKELEEHYKKVYRNKRKYYDKDYYSEASKKFFKRKQKLQGKELLEYHGNDTRKQRQRDWYLKNIDKIRKKHREYYQNNLEKNVIKYKKYYQDNKEILIKKSKEYRENNKEAISARRKKQYLKNKQNEPKNKSN